MENRPLFTVFTPVYNRSSVLFRPYESLVKQTVRNFEWIMIDDGSTDDSWETIQSFRADFPIRTVRCPENQGKHVVWNQGVDLATGDFFVPLDSDDTCVPETLETFESLWKTIPTDQQRHYSGINVLCMNPDTYQIIGDPFPQDSFDSNNLELQYKYHLRGEKWGCIRTDILRKFRFPEQYTTFLPENYLWFQIAREYKVRCANTPLRFYYLDQENSLSKHIPKFIAQNNRLKALLFYQAWHLNTNYDWLLQSKKDLMITGGNLFRFGFHMGCSALQLAKKITNPSARLWIPFFLSAGVIRYLQDRRMRDRMVSA